MTEEAKQTPQGEVGASEGEQSAEASEEQKKTSLLGSESEEAAGSEDEEQDDKDDLLTGDEAHKKSPLDEEDPAEGEDDSEEEEEGEEEEEQEGAPEEYTPFEVPEGMTLNEASMERASTVFQKLNLTQDQAQEAVNLHAELVQEAANEQRQALNDQRDQWVQEVQSDPNHAEKIADAKKAIEAFGDEGMKYLLFNEWMGDHPSVIETFSKIGKAMKSDTFIEGSASAGFKDTPEAMFDDMPGLPD